MFSPIIMLATNQITIRSEDTSEHNMVDEAEKTPISFLNNIKAGSPPSESFLSVLDDKNHTITNLRNQLQNQKMQLSYYIKRELDRTKIDALSASCTPQASEDSLPLNLAINKFCKQAGIKTKLSMLHDRMNRLDCKVSNLLKDQEFVLRKIVNRLCEFIKCQEVSRYADFQTQFGTFIADPLHVDLFDKLLGATISLSKKLNTFKICCDRLILIEEERNSIVEQVYSMPVEERINCNYLVGIQMEKVQLENEIRRISRHNAAGLHRIKELNVIEKILHNLQWELNSSFLNNEESCISEMVKKINSEARVLLEMTKEQKRRFELEVSKTKCPDSNRILFYIRKASEHGDGIDKDELERQGIKTEEDIGLFQIIKAEVDVIKGKTRQEAEKEIKKIGDECDKLKGKITQILLENSRTKVNNTALKHELQELKRERKNALQKLKQERDAYKCQVEDLQAIRQAYAQLVDKQPNTVQMEREFLKEIDERDRRVLDLENQVSVQNQELERLRVKVLDQNDRITVLNRFINLTRANTPRENEDIDKRYDANPGCSTFENYASFATQIKEKYAKMISHLKKEEEKKKSETPISKPRIQIPKFKKCSRGYAKNSTSYPTYRKKSTSNASNKNSKNFAKSETSFKENGRPACFEAISSNQNQGSGTDVVRAVVRTTEEIKCDESNGNIQKASLFSMEVQFSKSTINDVAAIECNEYELYKDCSKECIRSENRYKTRLEDSEYMN